MDPSPILGQVDRPPGPLDCHSCHSPNSPKLRRYSIGPPRLLVDLRDLPAQGPVRLRPAAVRPPVPRVVPAGRDSQHPALARDRIARLVRSYEFEDPDGIESVSRANQAAAFARISRSIRSRRLSRRSCASSFNPPILFHAPMLVSRYFICPRNGGHSSLFRLSFSIDSSC